MTRLPIAAALLLGVAVPALADAPYARCLRPNDVTEFQPVPGNHALIVTDAFRKNYRLNFVNPCYGLNFHTGISISRFGGGSSCLGQGDQVLLHDAAGPPRCFIHSVENYTPEMEKADATVLDLRQPVASRP